MSDLVRYCFAIVVLDKKAHCEGFCFYLAARVFHSAIAERTIGKRVPVFTCISLSLLLRFLVNC